MNKNDLINLYVDGEISDSELKELNLLIDADPFVMEEIKTIKLIENKLRKIKIDEAPAGFTDKIMNSVIFVKNNGIDKFYATIITVFILLILSIIVYLTSYSMNLSGTENSVINKSADWLKNVNIDKITRYFKNSDFILVSSFLSILILISSYFMQQNFRNFKKMVDSAGHK
ncbi:MAG: hypothetical protein V1773_10930 [bacterium]